jgi:putative endonuclease
MAKSIGAIAENSVAHYLTKRGYQVIGKNVTYPFGELDLVLRHQQTLVFCEVKYRKNQFYGAPFEAVTRAKQKKIILAAKAYLQKHHTSLPACRFDVVSLSGDLSNPVIEHIEDAFWDEG